MLFLSRLLSEKWSKTEITFSLNYGASGAGVK